MRLLSPATIAMAALAPACGAAAPSGITPRAGASQSAFFSPADAGAPPNELASDAATEAASTVSAESVDASSPIAETPASSSSLCDEQAPQDFLIRANFLKGGRDALERAIQYRTET